MGEVVVVTSLKGGVGKTMLSASLAYILARMGKRTLAVDMDLGTGGLDIALGRENEVASTFLDLLNHTSADDAIWPGEDGVYFLAAPVFFNESSLNDVTQDAFDSALTYLKEHFDYIIFDMPAGGGAAFRYFDHSDLVDQVLLVTTAAPTSVRAAERCIMRLERQACAKLVLNGYRLTKPDENPFGIVEIIERASTPIVGVIPFDAGAEKALAAGRPLASFDKSRAGRALQNVALRLNGDSVPLLFGVMKRRKRHRFY